MQENPKVRASEHIPADMRPLVTEPFHTAELPPTPQRDRSLPAQLWIEAPPELRSLGDDLHLSIGPASVVYKRRIGRWLLWRAGPAAGDHARYMALDFESLRRQFTFRLLPDGSGHGFGPDGVDHQRFRAWKESLRDSQAANS